MSDNPKSPSFDAEKIRAAALAAMKRDLPEKPCDPNAFTIAELAKEFDLSIPHMYRVAEKNVKDGIWIKTWKRVRSGPAPAYLPAPKKASAKRPQVPALVSRGRGSA